MSRTHTLDAFLRLPYLFRENLCVSPDGKFVAWSWYGADPAAQVYIVPTDGSASPRRLTNAANDTLVVGWTPDCRSILIHQDVNGNERYQLFRIDLYDGDKIVPLTVHNPNYYLRGGEVHPNGKWVVYGANLDVATNTEIGQTCVLRRDLETGERVELARPKTNGSNLPDLAPNGAHVIYPRSDLHPAGRQIWMVDIDGKHDREILNFGERNKVYASWFPDSTRLLFLVELPTHRKLGIYEIATGAFHWLIDDPARNIEEAYLPLNSDRIVVIEVKNAVNYNSLLDPETGEETALAANFAGDLLPLAPINEQEWVGYYVSSRQPDEIVRFSLDAVAPEHFISLTHPWERTSLERQDFTPALDFVWNSSDGLEIHGWLYRTAEKPRGTIIHVHGGPTWHTQDAYYPRIQYLARAGFNVLDPNYRGSTGFGIPFQEAIKEMGWGGMEQEDIRTGIETLIERGIAEPGKIGIMGVSYGGYSSWCAITRLPRDLIAAAVPICGMTDLVIDYETTRPDLRSYSAEMMGGTPQQVPERYYERSPIHFVDRIQGELLIVQGMQDPNVTPQNVRAVVTKLQQADIEYGLLAFDDEGHGVFKPKNVKRLLEQVTEFFANAFGT